MANRRKDVADWIFTTPSVIVQLVTGVGLAHVLGLSLTEDWVFWSLILYVFAGACWAPVVWMQIRMRGMAKQALVEGPERYWRLDRWWIILGSLAFPAVVVVIALMVLKP